MKKSKSLKNEVIQIRVTKEEKKAIIEKAKQMNMNRSKFIRHALLNSELEYSGRIEPPNPRVRATQSAGESH